MTSPDTRTLVELDGEVTELQALQSVAPACDCTIAPGPDDKFGWLSGTIIDDAATPQQARDEASKILGLLNGLARLENPQHHNVDLADCVFQSKRATSSEGTDITHMVLRHCASHGWRSRARSQMSVYGSFLGGVVAPPVDPAVERRRKRLVTEPKLTLIVEAFDQEISWQRLRVAFERVCDLVGGSDNALVRQGYASARELASFKANVQDPRHSGVEAVHGVPHGPLKGEKMTETEGCDFVVRLLNTYLEKQPPTVRSMAPKPKGLRPQG